MLSTSKIATGLLVAVVCVSVTSISFAQMTAKQFDALTVELKRSTLVDALQKREQAVENLQAQSETKVYNVKYRDGEAGERLEDISRFKCELRRRSGSYWARIDTYRNREKEPDHVRTRVFTSRAAGSDVVKSIARDGRDGVDRQIDPESGDSMIQMGQYHYWFDASYDRSYEFPVSFLLKHNEAIKFEGLSGDEKHVKVSLLYETADGTPFKDFRTLWLDPQKGFMPVRMKRRWEYATPEPFYSVLDTEITKLEQIDGVWFPMQMKMTCTARLSEANEYATVYETTVSDIKTGAMTDDDLQEAFAGWVAKEKPKSEPGIIPPAASSAPAVPAGD